MKKIFLIVWQLPQYLIGYLVLLWFKLFYKNRLTNIGGVRCDDYKNIVPVMYTYRAKWMGGKYMAFSLGPHMFLIYDDLYSDVTKMRNKLITAISHEYGHSVQSMYLGWLYLIIIGIPSFITAPVTRKIYTEEWAESIVFNKEVRASNYI